MSDWSGVGARPIHRITTEATSSTNARIVFLASRQVVYQCLLQAAQRHFSAYELSLYDQLSVADEPDDTVRLVLLGNGQAMLSASSLLECRRRFPSAAIGLVVEDAGQEIDQALIDQRLVQGVLPLTLPLDVWLAVMSLLVAGGEYLSEAIVGPGYRPGVFEHFSRDAAPPVQPHQLPTSAEHGVQALPEPSQRFAGRVLHGVDQASVLGIESLTARERQILKLVSEGYQNKLIADRMSLSEHTVKAHVHNLIAKLRVTNRTQAAAAFLHDQDLGQSIRPQPRADAGLVALHGR